MKIPHNSMQMWNMALTVILPPPPSTLTAPKTCLALSCVMIPLNGGALPRNDKNRNPQANIHASVIRAII